MEPLKTLSGNVMITGRRWFDKVNGNTYHSATLYVNGLEEGNDSFSYGYGDHYLQTGATMLWKKYEKPAGWQDYYPLSRLRDLGITFTSEVVDVQRKRDL